MLRTCVEVRHPSAQIFSACGKNYRTYSEYLFRAGTIWGVNFYNLSSHFWTFIFHHPRSLRIMILKTTFVNFHITDPQTATHVELCYTWSPNYIIFTPKSSADPHTNTLKNTTFSYENVVFSAVKNVYIERAHSLIFYHGRNTRFTTSVTPNTLVESGRPAGRRRKTHVSLAILKKGASIFAVT